MIYYFEMMADSVILYAEIFKIKFEFKLQSPVEPIVIVWRFVLRVPIPSESRLSMLNIFRNR